MKYKNQVVRVSERRITKRSIIRVGNHSSMLSARAVRGAQSASVSFPANRYVIKCLEKNPPKILNGYSRVVVSFSVD